MQTLIVCGSPWCSTTQVQQILETAGLAPALAANAGSIATPQVWHDRLLANHPVPLMEAVTPGKAWEMAASELFLANWSQPAWGWADPRSTWLLDFWHSFDPSTRFVLLYTPAATALQRAMANPSTPTGFDSQALLDQWCACQAEQLRFYLRHPSRCLLVDAELAITHPSELVNAITHHLGTPLNPGLSVTHATQPPAPLEHWLSQQLLAQHPAAQALEQEILASLPTLPDTAAEPANTAPPPSSAEHAANQLRALYAAQAELMGALQREAQRLDTLQAQHHDATICAGALERLSLAQQQQLAEQAQALAEQELQQHETNATLHTLQQALTLAQTDRDQHAQQSQHWQTQSQQTQHQLQEQQQEGELLLLQLHQVQEELEAYFLKAQGLEQQLGAAQTEQRTLHQQCADLTQERKAAAQAAHDAATQNTVLHAQLQQSQHQCHQVEEALAAARVQAQGLEQRLAAVQVEQHALHQQCTQASTERDAAALATHDAIASREALAAQAATLQTQLQQTQHQLHEQQQEGELLLLQLHQVQEELEHYFLQHQQAQQDKQQLQDRFSRLAARYPDYCEWSSIHPVDAPATAPRWHLHGLMAGGRSLPLIDVALDLGAPEAPALLLYPATQPALLHWPLAANATAPLQLQPLAPSHSPLAANLRQLTPTDLQLLHTICSALAQGLPTHTPDHQAIVQALALLQAQLKQLPETWRFDSVQLRHEQVNPDYEHLWLQLGNAAYGERQWPHFEFRLSAANVKKGKFSVHPKLEFPLPSSGNNQFENWFEESEDDRGPKFELRFDLKAHAMDINAWRALSPRDQSQALSMVAQLPVLLQRLQLQGQRISRPWEDWQGQALGIQITLQTCLGLPANTFAASA